MRKEMQISEITAQRSLISASTHARHAIAATRWFDCVGSLVNYTPKFGPRGSS